MRSVTWSSLGRLGTWGTVSFFIVLGILHVVFLVSTTPGSVGFDWNIYIRAVDRIADGGDPYLERRMADDPFVYSPQSLLLFEVVRPIPFLVPASIFLVCSLIGVGLLMRVSGGWWVVQGLCFLAFAPNLTTIVYGQVNLLVVALLAFCVLARVRHPRLAGVLLAVASIFKVAPVFFVLWFIVERDWRAVRWMILASLVLAVAFLIRHGAGPLIEYPSVLAGLNAMHLDGYWSSSLASKIGDVISRSRSIALGEGRIGDDWIQWLVYLLCAGLVGTSVVCAWFRRGQAPYLLAVLAVCVFLSPSVVWFHHFSMVWIAVGVLWRRSDGRPVWVIPALVVGLFVCQWDRNVTYGAMMQFWWWGLAAGLVFTQVWALRNEWGRITAS